jgi:hypothetical protein
LYAYQPIKYVDPFNWNGSQLTGASSFTNPRHPVVQATNADQPILGFTQNFVPHWDGLVEMRMLFTAINKSEFQSSYPAAILRVTGSTWSLVEGGGGSCSKGQGVSNEVKLLPKKDLAKAKKIVPAAQPGAASNSATSHVSKSSGSSSGGSSSGGGAKIAAADSSTGLSGGALAGIAVGALALAWVAIGLIARRRRRAST